MIVSSEKRMTSESTQNDNPQKVQSNPESIELPSFHGQLYHTPPQKLGGYDDWYGIFPTPKQRFFRFVSGFATNFLLALAFLAVLFIPDFALDYEHRGQKFIEFFWLIIGACVVIILTVSIILTFLNETRLYVSLKAGKIVLGRELSERYAHESLAIADIKELMIEPTSAVFKRARLIAVSGDSGYLIAETFGGSDDLIVLRDWLNETASQK